MTVDELHTILCEKADTVPEVGHLPDDAEDADPDTLLGYIPDSDG
jgi:hypothetical protein